MVQILLNSLLALLPVLAFTLLYRNYSVFPSGIFSHVFHLLSGIAGASILLLFSRFVTIEPDPWGKAFFLAALPERCIVLFLIALSPIRIHRAGSLSEMIMAGILIGLGFATMENLAYGLGQGYEVAFLRLLIPVPLHAALGAFSAHGLGLAILHRHPLYRLFYLVAGLAVPVVLHTLVDGLLFSGWDAPAGLLLVFILLRLEYLIARTQVIPPVDILESLGMTYEDWLLVQEQAGHERWLIREHGSLFSREPLFRFRWSAMRMIVVTGLLLLPLIYFLFVPPTSLPTQTLAEQRLVFILFPLFLSANLLLVGAINPEFFQKGMQRIPLNIRARMPSGVEITRSLHLFGCFVVTASPVTAANTTVILEKDELVSPILGGMVSWQNHEDIRQQAGTVLLFESFSFRALPFYFRVYLIQLQAGLCHRLRLPGFKGLAALFMAPESVSQDYRFFPAGTALFREGDQGDTFFLIKQGRVLVFRSGERETLELAHLGPGDLFGEMALAGHLPRNASARCETDCILAIGERGSLDRLIRSNADFARQLIELAAVRYHTSKDVMAGALAKAQSEVRWRRILERAGLRLMFEGLGMPGPRYSLQLSQEAIERLVPWSHARLIFAMLEQNERPAFSIPFGLKRRALKLSRSSYFNLVPRSPPQSVDPEEDQTEETHKPAQES